MVWPALNQKSLGPLATENLKLFRIATAFVGTTGVVRV